MVAVVSNPNRFVVRNSLEPKEVSRSEDLAKKQTRLRLQLLKQIRKSKLFLLKKKRRKIHIFLLCAVLWWF